MPQIEVEAIVTGSRPMEAYGGLRIADEALEQIATQIRSGKAPMIFEHDPRRPVGATVLDAGVRGTRDGFKEVWVRFRVDAEAWDEYQRDLTAKGAPGGFSFSGATLLTTLPGPPSAQPIALAADAYQWSDDDLLAAARELQRVATVNVSRRYAFALVPDAVVVVQLAVDLGLNLIASALYDALRQFIRPRRRTIFELRLERSRESASITARVETDDADVLRQAVDALTQVASESGLLFWNSEAAEWETPQLPGRQ
jgi:hypothetical protein